MEAERVLLELEADTRAVRRQGRVIGHHGSLFTVEWEDGQQDELRLGHRDGKHYVAVPAFGLRHQMLVDPGKVANMLETAPEDVFVLSLRDFDKAVSSRRLIERIKQDFPSSDISDCWRHARSAVEADPAVTVSGQSRQRAYQWTGQVDSPPSIEPHQTERHDPGLTSQAESRDSAQTTVSPSDPVLEAAPTQESPAVRLVRSSLARNESPRADDEDAIAALKSTLASGVALVHLSEKSLASAVRLLGRSACLIAAVPRKSKAADSVDVVAVLGTDGTAALLSVAEAELRALSSESPETDMLTRAHALLVRRCLSAPSSSQLSLDVILRATAAMSAEEGDAHADWVARMLASWLEHRGGTGWSLLSAGVRSDFTRRVVGAPLKAGSGRARVLHWLWRNDRSGLLEPAWWRGLTVDNLTELAETNLASALEHPPIDERHVRPLLSEAIAEVATRRRLMTILGAPSAVVRVLDPGDVKRAIVRVLGGDNTARAWLAEIGNEKQIQALRDEVARLSERANSLASELGDANAKAKIHEERSHRAELRLAQATDQVHELREGQARQIRIDVLRSLADVAAYVDGAMGVQPPERIRQRIESRLAREGLSQIGTPGQVVGYEPRLHELVGAAVDPGAAVTVRGVGYSLSTTDDTGEVVLSRALVERSE